MNFLSRRTLGILLGAVVLIAVFATLRRALGIELNPESIRDSIDRLGFWGPLVFVAIVALRIPLAVPSAFVLIGGGIIFGSVEGTIYGAAGLFVSASQRFSVALGRTTGGRGASRRADAIPVRAAGSRIGALVVAFGTA